MKKFLLLCFAAAVLAGCDKPLEKGTLVTDIATIEADSTNDGKRFAIEGFLSAPSTVTPTSGETESMYVYPEPEGEGRQICSIKMKYGYSNNYFRIASGDRFSDSDIKFKDNEGAEYNYDQKAMFSFTATRVPETKYDSGAREWKPTGGYNWEYVDVRVDPAQ